MYYLELALGLDGTSRDIIIKTLHNTHSVCCYTRECVSICSSHCCGLFELILSSLNTIIVIVINVNLNLNVCVRVSACKLAYRIQIPWYCVLVTWILVLEHHPNFFKIRML